MYCLYRHIRLDKNVPFYIGIGDEDRAYSKFGRNAHWNNIVNKTEYEIEILIEGLTWQEACKKEIEFIQLYGRNDLNLGTLVNLTNGGEGAIGRKVSAETREKISKSNKGRKVKPEVLELMIKRKLGSKLSEKTRQKMSIAHKGKKKSSTHAANIGKSRKGVINWAMINKAKLVNKGKKHTIETINKRREKLCGRKNNLEAIEKMRKIATNLKGKKILCLNNGVVYNSMAECERQLNIQNVWAVCNNKISQTKGYVFKYYNNY